MILPAEIRLKLLNLSQPNQPWESCAEKRLCIVCDRTFRGSSATVRGTGGSPRLSCPSCGSGPEFWVRPGNPLIDVEIWADWERAIEQSAAEDPEEEKHLGALS